MGNSRNSNVYLLLSLFIAALGLAPLFNSMSNPRIANLHATDILQLSSIGWCFGLAAAFLVVYFRGPMRSESR
jgi:cytosine/uracil/thiamine/allantoin permease